MTQNKLFRYILKQKVAFWGFNYLYAWRSTFGSENNIRLVDDKINVARQNYTLIHKIIGKSFNIFFRIIEKGRKLHKIAIEV